ncbi:MFS general substrate transporter [Coccomyxa subellipsoidea C-169]|uniref:MFS general substrate transporter n=1 Tax=Coccomyxa subellipsoidea (strain C-169) TaxID=574566 RepID=I0YPU8_COCSC|nr:MFS general substrate transporter [Coccomyxa subellipsoidea C-169]EIE20417.1 MFS general substrate transporter [Coccomyxa subellipsoidea C-169]|eukprot:XP_005644961.1 MFS general substrate transporter [Coccomyxa subellipsoidea C-169]
MADQQRLLDGMPQDVEQGGDADEGPTYTVGEALDCIGFGRFQGMVLFYCGCAWAADAVEMMLLSFLGPAVRCEWGISPSAESLITSIVFCGTMLGAYGWGVLGDAKGRRVGFAATAAFTFAFGILSAASPNYLSLVVLRGLMGVGLGGAPVAFALFLELVPSSKRGVLMVALQSFWTVGSMLEAALAWAILTDWGWRWLVAISSLPLLALLLLYPFLPESPYWLVASGRTADAQALLQRIAHANGRPLPPGRLAPSAAAAAAAKAQADSKALEVEGGTQGSTGTGKGMKIWGPLSQLATAFRPLLSGDLRRTTLLLLLIWFVNALCYYGLVLLTTSLHSHGGGSGCSTGGRLVLSSADLRDIFVASTAELPGLLLAAAVMDGLGRKWPLAASQLVIAAATGSLLLAPGRWDTALLFIGRACSMGSYAILYVYTPEVFPTRVRTFGLGVNNAMSRIGALVSPFLAVDLVERGSPGIAEGTLALACLAAAVACAFLPLETSGKELAVDGAANENSQEDGEMLPPAPSESEHRL